MHVHPYKCVQCASNIILLSFLLYLIILPLAFGSAKFHFVFQHEQQNKLMHLILLVSIIHARKLASYKLCTVGQLGD